ncbi:MAG: flavodoxin domain-containing protein [Euryarchaeota archaeon]|nr:flavodoxin domain-containing protein [Euryarchaeota archaeon]
MSKKVLVAYGSRYGSTEEIARAIGEILEKEGLKTQVLDLKRTKQKEWPPLASFDAVLVGSGIKIGRWTDEASSFLKKHAGELKTLKANGLVVGVFVSCGLAVNPEQRQEAQQKYIEKILTEIGIKDAVDTYDAFGGVYDLSPSAPMGFLDKKMLAMGAKQMVKDGTVTEGARNDLRDWNQIRTFADHFVDLVKNTGKEN